MATRPIIPALRLTAKTVEEIRADAIARIPTLTDRWTDFNDAEVGVVLLTTLAGMLEALMLELDLRASETTVTYVRQRRNAVRLLRLIGYEFKRKVAARVPLEITLGAPAAKPIPLRDYTHPQAVEFSARTSDAVFYALEQPAVIPAGATGIIVSAVQGRRVARPPVAATGQPNQVIALTSQDIAHGSVRVHVAGVPWQVVPHFVNSSETSRHARELTDEDGGVTLTFGDGTAGQIPSGSIEVFYLDTLGPGGNFGGRSRVTAFSSYPLHVDGTSVIPPPAVTNMDSSIGGEDEETLFHAKKQAPREYQAQQRAVTKLDFVAWAEGFPGVQQAACADINDVGPESFLIDYFEIKIPIIPTGALRPNASLKKALQERLEVLKAVPDNIEVLDPDYVPVAVSVEFYARKNAGDPLLIKAAVQAAILLFFSPAESPGAELALFGETEGQVFGQSVSFSQLLTAVQSVPGVASIASITPSEDVFIGALEIATLSLGSPVVTLLGVV